MDRIKVEIRQYFSPLYFRTGFFKGQLLYTNVLWVSEYNDNQAFLITIKLLKKLPTYNWCEAVKSGDELFTVAPKEQKYATLWSGHVVEKKYEMLVTGFLNYYIPEWL